MISSKKLLIDLKKQVTLLEDDLRQRCKEVPEIDAPLRAAYDAAKAGKRTAMTYGAWLDDQLTQVAVAWVLACVFVRFLEDNGLVEVPKLAGPGTLGQRARDEHELFFQKHPTLTEREYLEGVFTETGTLPAMREFFDRRHNPLWQCGPSGDAAAALLDFWRKADPDSGLLVHDFTDAEFRAEPGKMAGSHDPTRFLGDLYQDLSEAARKKYALLQTPEFIEEFILDRTLGPAIASFGYQIVRLIDPTCGSGHFLLGGFSRMFRLWQQENPGENPRVLAQNALHAINGVDLNPYAVAIARFRLLLAALQVCGITKLKNAPDFSIHLASGDSLLHGRRFRESEGESRRQTLFDSDEDVFRDELAHHYEVEDTEALHRILGQQYHAVVGNPPYINVKDRALSELYRSRYPSCHGKYSLSVPFMERFFDLALRGDGTPQQSAGYTGQITSNSFMKRGFGKKLIQEYLPRWDLTHVLDTAGAYIPGHGTPTVILLGRNQLPVTTTIRTVLGISGEPSTPVDPAKGLVWQAIIHQIDEPNIVSEWMSSADSPRNNFYRHPWSIGGGGASELKELIDEGSESRLAQLSDVIGILGMTNADDIMLASDSDFRRSKIEPTAFHPLITGDLVRDWTAQETECVLFPYLNGSLISLDHVPGLYKWLWVGRTILGNRATFNKMTYFTEGRAWWAWHQVALERLISPLVITYAYVATHNHFMLERGKCVFKQTSPIIKLKLDSTVEAHVAILGLLNSSVGCFWMKQVAQNRGSTVDDKGARQRTAAFEDFYEFTSTHISRFPIATKQPIQLAATIVDYRNTMLEQSPASTIANWCRNNPGNLDQLLIAVRSLCASQRRNLIAWQEELDWQIYEAYDLIESTDRVSLPEGEAMGAIPPEGLELGQRAFEIVLARRMAAGEVQTTWFTRHGSTPITEIPDHWPAAYRELVECRIRRIESDSNIRLIEQPEYKRRWNTESWESQFQRAATEWLLLRLETYFHGSERMKPEVEGQKSKVETEMSEGSSSAIQNSPFNIQNFDPAAHGFIAASRPYLVSAQQLAEVVQADPLFLEVAECMEGNSGFSVSALVQRLVEAESVPALPRDRYKDSGLCKREDWEATWELQRLEDEIEEETRRQNPELREEELKKLVRKAQLETVGEIAVPPKYGSPDFKKASYWKLRGKLDVPKERWISYIEPVPDHQTH